MSEAPSVIEGRRRVQVSVVADMDVLAASSLAALVREFGAKRGDVMLTALERPAASCGVRRADASSPMQLLCGGYEAGTVLAVEGSSEHIVPVVAYLSGLCAKPAQESEFTTYKC